MMTKQQNGSVKPFVCCQNSIKILAEHNGLGAAKKKGKKWDFPLTKSGGNFGLHQGVFGWYFS